MMPWWWHGVDSRGDSHSRVVAAAAAVGQSTINGCTTTITVVCIALAASESAWSHWHYPVVALADSRELSSRGDEKR